MERLILKEEFKPHFPVSLVEQVADFLTKAIIEDRVKGGQQLVENELQRQFGISRAPIREAFRILERNGLLVIYPRKGAFVKKISKKDVEENFPIRAYLEGLAARLATPRLSSQDIQELEKALSHMEKAARKSDYRSYMKHHIHFHEIFIKAGRNETLIQILENLRRHALLFRFSYFYTLESFEDAIKVHRQILDQFIAKEAGKAEKMVKNHILAALNGFLKFLESRG